VIYIIIVVIGGEIMDQTTLILDGLILELRRGTLILSILSQLNHKEYPYSLIKKLSDQGLDIQAGTLYPLLRRLEEQGLLDSTWDLVENRPRRYYQISNQGSSVYQQLKKEWLSLNQTITQIINQEER